MHVLNENPEDKIRTSKESQQSHSLHFDKFYMKNMNIRKISYKITSALLES